MPKKIYFFLKKFLDETLSLRYALSMNIKKEYDEGEGVKVVLDFDNLKDYALTTWAIHKATTEMLASRFALRNRFKSKDLRKSSRETVHDLVKVLRLTKLL